MFLFGGSKKVQAPAVKASGTVAVGQQAVYALLPWRGLLVTGTADGVVRIWDPKGVGGRGGTSLHSFTLDPNSSNSRTHT
jgi:hypothetical protein